jgi:hypothetical protein
MTTTILPENFNLDVAEEKYQEVFLSLKNTAYIDYPLIVSLETLALCDAGCDFCPYPGLERKGARMPDEVLEKVIQDLEMIPRTLPIFIVLARVNEPFLDKRIYELVSALNERLPNAQLILFSNGSPLNDKALDRIEKFSNIYLFNLSFNEHRESDYEKVMQLPYSRTIRNLDALHTRLKSGSLNFPVRISRVGNQPEVDEEFISFAHQRWPLFEVAVSRRSDWMGKIEIPSAPVVSAGCTQWFGIGVHADGKIPFCCMDSEALHTQENILSGNLLEIYNRPTRRQIREHVISRQEVDICKGCHLFP